MVRVPGKIEWSPGRVVTTAVAGGSDGPAVVVLAHGAGAGRTHPFMAALSGRLAAGGLQVVTFDYPYMAEGRRAPDRLETLVAAHRAVIAAVPHSGRGLVLAGKSMGGRVASHLTDVPCDGLVFFGYPLVAVGKTAPRDTSHLGGRSVPMLFIQGERDRLAPLEVLRPVVGRLPHADLVVISDADHSFRVPKRSGRTDADVIDQLATAVLAWGPAGGRASPG